MAASLQSIGKSYIVLLENDKELKEGARARINYLATYPPKMDVELISPNALKDKKGPLTIMLHGHGSVNNTGYIHIDKELAIKYEGDKNGKLSPKQFAKYLASFLPKNTARLELLICYSSETVQPLCQEMAKLGYPNLVVIGYQQELCISQGKNSGMLAGLPYALVHDANGRLDLSIIGNPSKSTRSSLNPLLSKYDAINFQVRDSTDKYPIKKVNDSVNDATLTLNRLSERKTMIETLTARTGAAQPSVLPAIPATLQHLARQFNQLSLSPAKPINGIPGTSKLSPNAHAAPAAAASQPSLTPLAHAILTRPVVLSNSPSIPKSRLSMALQEGEDLRKPSDLSKLKIHELSSRLKFFEGLYQDPVGLRPLSTAERQPFKNEIMRIMKEIEKRKGGEHNPPRPTRP